MTWFAKRDYFCQNVCELIFEKNTFKRYQNSFAYILNSYAYIPTDVYKTGIFEMFFTNQVTNVFTKNGPFLQIWSHIVLIQFYIILVLKTLQTVFNHLVYTIVIVYKSVFISRYGTDSNYVLLEDVYCSTSNYLVLLQCSYNYHNLIS